MERIVKFPPSPLLSREITAEHSLTIHTRPSTGEPVETSALVINEVDVVPSSPQHLAAALRLFARWLISAARKGPPVAHSGPVEGTQNCLDVPRSAEVASKPEAGEMAVQQAIRRNTR